VNFTATPLSAITTKSVALSWTASTSTNIKGYNVYRADVAGGTYVKRNASLVGMTSYMDTATSGRTYYYVATAVDNNSVESSYSNQAATAVP
jgi:fibronectin type 3 domain-containing protein